MRFFQGLVTGVILVVLGAYLFIIGGGMPVATQGKPLPLERLIAQISLHAAFREQAKMPAPFAVSPAHFLSGARVYRNHCAGCHGMLDQKESRFAEAMYPHPPFLLPPHEGVTDDPVGETYWKTKNGIRLTGMPGFVDILNDTELWEVSLFLANADHLPPEAQAQLK
jgi:thiosulfate dehydrogenase